MEVKPHQQFMEKRNNKNITENDAKMKRPKAMGPEGPEPALGLGVPEEVRSSSRDSRSRFPHASNIVKKQTSGKQLKSNLEHQAVN